MIYPASGTGTYVKNTAKIIRFARHGCTNRPFYHIVVTEVKRGQHDPVIEQVGMHDPFANEHNEKLTTLNLERIRYWIGNGADVSKPVSVLFGLAGLFPIHPTSYMIAWRNRQIAEKNKENKEDIKNSGEMKS